jgi:hypothetical protein
MRPGVEQETKSASLGIERTEVCPFISVAPPASQGEIFRISYTSVLDSNYMVNFVREETQRISQQTILAAVGSAFFNVSAKVGRNISHKSRLAGDIR